MSTTESLLAVGLGVAFALIGLMAWLIYTLFGNDLFLLDLAHAHDDEEDES